MQLYFMHTNASLNLNILKMINRYCRINLFRYLPSSVLARRRSVKRRILILSSIVTSHFTQIGVLFDATNKNFMLYSDTSY